MHNLGRTEEAEARFKQAEALKPNNQLYHVRSGLRSFTGGFGLVLLVEMTGYYQRSQLAHLLL